MMRIFALTVLLLCAFTFYNAQNKIVLKRGLASHKIKKGLTFGVTLKGQAFNYESWKFGCFGCSQHDSLCNQNLWTLDSISENRLVLLQVFTNALAYRLDTISENRIKQYEQDVPGAVLIKTLPGGANVYRICTAYHRITVPLDSIASFTFAQQKSCVGFSILVPFFAAFTIVAGAVASISERSAIPLIMFEPIGLGLTYMMYVRIKNNHVYTYATDRWRIVIR